jgi:plasmid stability protein
MSIMTIDDLDDDLMAALRARAAANGRSMESEALEILRQTLTNQETGGGLGSRIAARFANLDDGPPLELPARTELPGAVDLPE